MPVQTRSHGDPPVKVTYTSVPPAPKQKHFPPRRRQVKTYGRPRNVRRMQQETLTQMNFVSQEEVYIDLDDEDETNDTEPAKEVTKKSKSKATKGSRRKTLGDEADVVERPSTRGNKRRKTMGDTPSMSAPSSFHTQTLTQFLSTQDENEDPWQVDDSEAEEDVGVIMETPRKPKEGRSSEDTNPVTFEKEPDQGPGSQRSKLATPSNRKTRTEIPSSESPAITPMLMRYSPLASRKSPLKGRSTNAEPPSPIIRSIHKRSRDMIIQDTFSTSHDSPYAGTPTPKATVNFSTPKKLRFEIPEDKENITPGRTKPKTPKPTRKTPARLPLQEVPDSDAEDEESIAGSDPDPSVELGESESTDALPESPTPMGKVEGAVTHYGFLGDEIQAEIFSSDHFQDDAALHSEASTSVQILDDATAEAPIQTPDQPVLDDQEPETPTTLVIEQSPPLSPQMQTSDENPAPQVTQGHNYTQYTQDLESQRLPLEAIHALGPQTFRSDIMVSLHPEHLAKVVDGTKNHEFRVWKIPSEVSRVWLYTTRPISELRYMCVFGPPKEPGQVEDENGVGNKAFNQGKTVGKYAHEILQVYELNDPVSLQDMIRKGWIKGAPQKYNYIAPAVVGELTANLRCALFGENQEEGPTEPSGSHPNVTESQEIRAQLQSDVAYSTQHHHSDLEDEVIPSSQKTQEPSPKYRGTSDETRVFARPALPKASSSSAAAMTGASAQRLPGASDGLTSPREQQQQNSIIRPSQATTVTQMSSSPAVSPEKSLRHRRGGDAIMLSGDMTSPEQQYLPPQHSSSPTTRQQSSSRRRPHHSLRSSQFLTRSQMLPNSLLNDETREPPPIIWDSADEQSD